MVTIESSVDAMVQDNENVTSTKRISDNRRSNKPIMEKRRRARINNCLNELKTLILDAMKKDPARHSKLEKADILEMTVRHLQNLQRQQVAMNTATDPAILNKYRAGFSECATEVGRFPGLEPTIKRKLLQHLAQCLNKTGKEAMQHQVQVHILPTTAKTVETKPNNNNGIILTNGSSNFHLLPTRLPNGDIALVLPNTTSTTDGDNTRLPLLVPIIPERTSSTGSSVYSPSTSPEPNLYNQPLSLVVRKSNDNNDNDNNEEKPWRPW